METTHRILVLTDLSADLSADLSDAVQFAQRDEAELHLLYVVLEPSRDASAELSFTEMEDLVERMAEAAEQHATASSSVPVRYAVRRGSGLAEAVQRYIDDYQIDGLVLSVQAPERVLPELTRAGRLSAPRAGRRSETRLITWPSAASDHRGEGLRS